MVPCFSPWERLGLWGCDTVAGVSGGFCVAAVVVASMGGGDMCECACMRKLWRIAKGGHSSTWGRDGEILEEEMLQMSTNRTYTVAFTRGTNITLHTVICRYT